MKKLILCAAIFLTATFVKNAEAQVRLNVNVNIGAQPVWGPVGYDYVDYYYLPDIETYYYVPTHQFVYFSGGRWVFAAGLPPIYRGYNLYNGYKVVINEPKPYLLHSKYKVKYIGYKGNHSQTIIRNSNDPKYYVVKGHPKHVSSGKMKGNGPLYKSGSGGGASKGGGAAKGKGGGKGKNH